MQSQNEYSFLNTTLHIKVVMPKFTCNLSKQFLSVKLLIIINIYFLIFSQGSVIVHQ